MAWSIWTTRNDWIFNNIDPSVENCKQKFISEFSLMMHKIRTDKAPPMLVWLHTLLDLAVIFLFLFLSVPHFVLFFLLLVCTRFSLLCNTLVFLIICSRGLAPPVFFKKKAKHSNKNSQLKNSLAASESRFQSAESAENLEIAHYSLSFRN
jgi:hypothetical protein